MNCKCDYCKYSFISTRGDLRCIKGELCVGNSLFEVVEEKEITEHPTHFDKAKTSGEEMINHPIDKAKTSGEEMINHPSHYNMGKYEAIDVIEDWGLNFQLGNTIKYISRAGYKDDIIQDLKKARWYLDREIKRLEDEQQ